LQLYSAILNILITNALNSRLCPKIWSYCFGY